MSKILQLQTISGWSNFYKGPLILLSPWTFAKTTAHTTFLKVNIFQKHLCLHQLTHNTYDKRFFIELVQLMKIASSKHVVYTNCSECQNRSKKQFVYVCTQHVKSLQFSCTEQSVPILWVSWCKNHSFWQRFKYL